MKHESRPAIHLEKQLGWAQKLGGAESLGISKAGQTSVSQFDGVSDMAPACWLCVWRGEDSEKGKWLLLALMPHMSIPPLKAAGPFKLLSQC